MRKPAVIVCLLCFVVLIRSALGQSSITSDTLVIEEVVINNAIPDGASGYRKTTLSAKDIREASPGKLSQLLERQTALILKNYGNGGLASASFRGLGPNHTSIFWNGIKINSVMTGQNDLSIIPVIYADKIEIYHGSTSGNKMESGPGGAISLSTVPDWKKGMSADLDLGIGSFGTYKGHLAVLTGTNRFQYRVTIFSESSRNNFSFTDSYNSSEPTISVRTNSAYTGRGLLQEVYGRSEKNIWSARVWYNYSFRNLPGPVVSVNDGTETQLDESIMTMVSYNHYFSSGSMQIKAAWISDWLNYLNSVADINSKNKSDNYVISASIEKSFGDKFKVNFNLSNYSENVNSINYSAPISRNRLNSDFEISVSPTNWLGFLFSVREKAIDGRLFLPEPSLGFDLKLNSMNNISLSGNVGKSIHIPSLNDLYWYPGGNSGLENEVGVNSELSISANHRINSIVTFNTIITSYYSKINNMIKWLPGDFTYWTPLNLQEVKSRGAEGEMKFDLDYEDYRISFSGIYSWTRVENMIGLFDNDNSTGKQLIYVPEHQGRISARFSSSRYLINWYNRITGKRFVTSDNSNALPAYVLSDLSVGVKFNIMGHNSVATIRIDNIFGAEYENIAYYPMPGRSFQLNFKLKFTNR